MKQEGDKKDKRHFSFFSGLVLLPPFVHVLCISKHSVETQWKHSVDVPDPKIVVVVKQKKESFWPSFPLPSSQESDSAAVSVSADMITADVKMHFTALH